VTIPGVSFPPPPLVGREREQGVLRDYLAAALAGHGGLVLIGGEAGIGKTALAESLGDTASAHGALVLVGCCYDLSETPPYGPWVELFGRYQSENGSPLPVAFAQRGTVGAVSSQAALFQQVQEFLTLLATQRPLVLLLDDLLWADHASINLLRFLSRSLMTLPLLIVVTYRSDELTRLHPLYGLLPVLVHEARAERLDLHPLTENDLRAMVERRYHLGPADSLRLITYLHERGEGNPFFLGELLRTIEEEGILRATDNAWALGDLVHVRVPPLLRQVIDARLARLGENAQDLLAVAAVIGQEVPLPLWGTIGNVDEERLLALTDQAEEARFITLDDSGGHARFVHALIRESLHEGLPPHQRRALHRETGEALMRSLHPDPDAVAYHFRQAGDARAVEWLTKAGERAHRSWAWLTAAERYEAALPLLEGSNPGERARLLYLIAVLRQFVSPQSGIPLLEEAISLATQMNDQVLTACATLYRGTLRCYVQEYRRGLLDLEAGAMALDALTVTNHSRIRELDLMSADIDVYSRWDTIAAWYALLGRYSEARTLGERLMVQEAHTSRETRQPRYSRAGANRARGIVYAGLGAPDAARASYRRARDNARASRDHYSHTIVALDELERVLLPYYADEIGERGALAAEAEAAWCQASGVYREVATASLTHLLVLALEGRWTEARQLALAVRETQSLAALRRVATRVLGLLAHYQGDNDVAWSLVREVVPDGPTTAPGDIRFLDAQSAQQLAIALAIEAGDLAVAHAWLEAHDRWLAWSGSVPGRSEGQALWAHFYRVTGDPDQADTHAERALAHADEPRQPLALLAAHRLRGELDTDARRFPSADMHLSASLALADACQAPYERALTLLARAHHHAATKQPAAAIALLGEVRAICAPLDAKPTLARADALLARIKPSPAPLYRAGLTEREIEVLRLIAAGQTNRQIADALFLSERTVHVHARNIFAKTGTDNRAGATAFAFRHGLA
jgi:DNA-binding CsgD family transcriptional regulator